MEVCFLRKIQAFNQLSHLVYFTPLEEDGVGLTVQVGGVVDGAMLVDGAAPGMVSARTRTGMTAPVTNPKGWCPTARRIAAMEPEWLVRET